MTKEKAIKLIDDRMCYGRGKWSEHHMPEIDDYWKAGQIAIKALEEPQWIPCSERLPEEGREVLACLTDWKTGGQRRVVSYRMDFNMWHGYGRYNEKCVAWMPLPEPWRGDAE